MLASKTIRYSETQTSAELLVGIVFTVDEVLSGNWVIVDDMVFVVVTDAEVDVDEGSGVLVAAVDVVSGCVVELINEEDEVAVVAVVLGVVDDDIDGSDVDELVISGVVVRVLVVGIAELVLVVLDVSEGEDDVVGAAVVVDEDEGDSVVVVIELEEVSCIAAVVEGSVVEDKELVVLISFDVVDDVG
uniref:Uncharacterized protein n=1 Tax=Plectus sambesii TaxID=2011161 RepID=A0A914WGC8_9BILA